MKNLVRKILYKPAPRAYYNIFFNVFGLNALRAISSNFTRKIKGYLKNEASADQDPAIQMLEEEGIAVIENFLNEEEYKKLIKIYKKSDLQERMLDHPDVPQFAYKQISTPLKLYDQEISEIVLKNERLKKIVESISGKK